LRKQGNLERTANDLAQAIEVFAKEYLPLAKVAGDERPTLQPLTSCPQKSSRAACSDRAPGEVAATIGRVFGT
jgi:hypothetical protein